MRQIAVFPPFTEENATAVSAFCHATCSLAALPDFYGSTRTSCLTCTVHMLHGSVMTLSDWITTNGLTDERAADLFGCDRAHVSKLRRGRCRPSLDLMVRIRDATKGAVSLDSWADAVTASHREGAA